jgi:hypothetical protein
MRKGAKPKPGLKGKESPPTAPSLRELLKNSPNMVEATGEFQAMILGHSKNEPEPESELSAARQAWLNELAKVDLRNG